MQCETGLSKARLHRCESGTSFSGRERAVVQLFSREPLFVRETRSCCAVKETAANFLDFELFRVAKVMEPA